MTLQDPMSGGFPLDHPEMCDACRVAYQEMSEK